ncbi:hypothetical protein [Paenibacillus sp. y28]|uniref:hypothetical protein n=1 Tax=Paenibacillus sp. y28 TaxID=3129110 RepID=UPI003015EC2D
MRLQDALFNWLQIRLVSEGRPGDGAAMETQQFFMQILEEDHKLSQVGFRIEDEEYYIVHYIAEGQPREQRFDRELADQLLAEINANPKYNDSPIPLQGSVKTGCGNAGEETGEGGGAE